MNNKLRQLTRDDVTISIEVEQEDIPVRDHFCTDEPEKDRELEEEILRRLDAGDVWAWAFVTVRVKWKGFVGTDSLGCCSYASEEDFIKSNDYYEGMVSEALADLNRSIAAIWAKIAELAT